MVYWRMRRKDVGDTGMEIGKRKRKGDLGKSRVREVVKGDKNRKTTGILINY